MSNNLILLTAGFPYGDEETFLEMEIEVIAKKFDKVIFLAVNPDTRKCRKLPENCEINVFRISHNSKHKVLSFLGLFNPILWQELKIIKKIYRSKINFGKIKTILMTLRNSVLTEKKIDQITSKDKSADWIIYSYWYYDSAMAAAMHSRKNKNFKSVSRVHGWDLYFERSFYDYLPFRHFIAKNLTWILPVSSIGKDYVQNKWALPNIENVKLSRLGVKKQEDISFDNVKRNTIVSCSNIIPLKRLDLIIESLSQVGIDNLHWVHFGNGPLEANIKKLAEEKLQGKATFDFKGKRTNAEVLEFYRHEKPGLFINLSTTEGVPVSIMEAMSFGIPVLAADVGGTSEIVLKEGMVKSDESSLNIALKINDSLALSDEEDLILRKKVLEEWSQKCDGEKNYGEFVELLK
jgi:colanic acid/amylovoran biosynthesis glycosyltransferase